MNALENKLSIVRDSSEPAAAEMVVIGHQAEGMAAVVPPTGFAQDIQKQPSILIAEVDILLSISWRRDMIQSTAKLKTQRPGRTQPSVANSST